MSFVILQPVMGAAPAYGPYGVCAVQPGTHSYATPYGYQQQPAAAAAAGYPPSWPPAATIPPAAAIAATPYGAPPRGPVPMTVYGGAPGGVPAPWRPPQ